MSNEIAEDLLRLRQRALEADRPFLAYLIDMARHEAENSPGLDDLEVTTWAVQRRAPSS